MGGLPTWAGLENMLQPAAMERGMVHGWTCNLCQYFGARLESLRLMDIKELKTHAKNYHHFPEEGMDQYMRAAAQYIRRERPNNDSHAQMTIPNATRYTTAQMGPESYVPGQRMPYFTQTPPVNSLATFQPSQNYGTAMTMAQARESSYVNVNARSMLMRGPTSTGIMAPLPTTTVKHALLQQLDPMINPAFETENTDRAGVARISSSALIGQQFKQGRQISRKKHEYPKELQDEFSAITGFLHISQHEVQVQNLTKQPRIEYGSEQQYDLGYLPESEQPKLLRPSTEAGGPSPGFVYYYYIGENGPDLDIKKFETPKSPATKKRKTSVADLTAAPATSKRKAPRYSQPNYAGTAKAQDLAKKSATHGRTNPVPEQLPVNFRKNKHTHEGAYSRKDCSTIGQTQRNFGDVFMGYQEPSRNVQQNFGDIDPSLESSFSNTLPQQEYLQETENGDIALTSIPPLDSNMKNTKNNSLAYTTFPPPSTGPYDTQYSTGAPFSSLHGNPQSQSIQLSESKSIHTNEEETTGFNTNPDFEQESLYSNLMSGANYGHDEDEEEHWLTWLSADTEPERMNGFASNRPD